MKPILDWSSYQDAGTGDAYADIPKTGDNFARAIATCINSRQCENKNKGVMCPSFRVSDNSHLSTGGRVKLLKSALNGELAEQAFLDDTLRESMELCVACKGCKRECENEVDMAMIKVEYLAQIHKLKKPSLRTRFLASFPSFLNKFPYLKPLLQLRKANGFIAKITESLLRISARRSIPLPVRHSFCEQYKPIKNSADDFHTEVVLFVDTFNNHFAPDIIQSAIEVLNKGGYQVILAQDNGGSNTDQPLCCGRTHIANGMVEAARREAKRTLSVLHPHVQKGRKIIGLEPACLLAIRDDYRFLGLGQIAEEVAAQALLFEEFIAREIAAKRFKVDFKAVENNQSPIMVHGHCHQKAVGAMKSMRRLLKKIPQLNYEFIDSSCCGMAGSFGIEAEHADIAMEMAEQSLIPTINAQPDSQLVANGFSCRHQIKEGTGRSSIHIAELLQQALN